MYLSSNAAAMAHKHNHKTFSAQDVLDSINEMDFKNFTVPMKNALVIFQKSMKDKKNNKKNSLEARKSNVGSNNHQQTIPALTSPATSASTKTTMQSAASVQPLMTISSDIIEIDDSD